MTSVETMTSAELAALLLFHAEAGVEWLVDDEPVDRIAEFSAAKAARSAGSRPSPPSDSSVPAPQPDQRGAAAKPAPRLPQRAAQTVVIPDGEADSQARAVATAADSLEALRAAMADFTGCNLRNSAKSLIFADGNPGAGIMIVGGQPSAEDDKEGLPFSGREGQMLERMLGAIGLSRENALLSTVIPWRPPGDHPPTQHVVKICQPFIERQIALAAPRHLLLLGNLAARVVLDSKDTIHHLRGEWRSITIGGTAIETLATLHPQDLIKAPAAKGLAWQDLLSFRARLQR